MGELFMSANREVVMINDEEIVEALDDAGIDYDSTSYDPEKPFRNNGIDSLDVMSLFLAIEERHGVKFSEAEATAIQSPRQLSTALAEKLRKS
jgi:acyl carrier protein